MMIARTNEKAKDMLARILQDYVDDCERRKRGDALKLAQDAATEAARQEVAVTLTEAASQAD